jgi:hypothetical protein
MLQLLEHWECLLCLLLLLCGCAINISPPMLLNMVGPLQRPMVGPRPSAATNVHMLTDPAGTQLRWDMVHRAWNALLWGMYSVIEGGACSLVLMGVTSA